MKLIKIDTPYITLGQLLKMTDIISSGGMAKIFLEDATIFVNQERENRRGRKLYQEDLIKVEGYGEFKITH